MAGFFASKPALLLFLLLIGMAAFWLVKSDQWLAGETLDQPVSVAFT